MKVRPIFFAQLRDVAGSEMVDFDLPDGATISDLLERVYARFPALRVHDKTILVGVGVEFVDRDYEIKPDDEVAIMPPVQGG